MQPTPARREAGPPDHRRRSRSRDLPGADADGAEPEIADDPGISLDHLEYQF
jgi:hypothetical protein